MNSRLPNSDEVEWRDYERCRRRFPASYFMSCQVCKSSSTWSVKGTSQSEYKHLFFIMGSSQSCIPGTLQGPGTSFQHVSTRFDHHPRLAFGRRWNTALLVVPVRAPTSRLRPDGIESGFGHQEHHYSGRLRRRPIRPQWLGRRGGWGSADVVVITRGGWGRQP